MKKVLSVILCFALMTAIFAVTTGALTEEEAYAGYYLVGTMTGWEIDYAYRFDENPSDSSEYMISGCTLTASDAFKAVYSHDGHTIDEYYPAGVGNNCTLAAQDIFTDSIVDLYFRPNMDGQDGWYFGCIYLELKSAKPTESTEPTENNGEIGGGYYIVFKNEQNRIRECYRMYRMGANTYWRGDVTMSTATPFKIAYSEDLQTAATFWPAGENNYYVPRYNSRYMTVIFTPEGDNSGDSSDAGWYDGYVSAYPCEPPQEDSTEAVPVNIAELDTDRYEEAFRAAYPFLTDYCDYEEIYSHRNMFDCDDWVLVRTPLKDPVDGGSYGVFDEIAVYASESYPFTLGFGVFDLKEQRFYSIDEAWNMGFDDLHDVFVHIAPRYAYTLVLGDADCDDELTIVDVTVIQRSLAFIKELDDEVFMHTPCAFGPAVNHLSDYDRDGEVSILDATWIQRDLIGIYLYTHQFTESVKLEKKADGWYSSAAASFGEEPVTYCYSISGGVHANSVYGNDWGDFTYYDPAYEPMPGDFYVTTGFIAKDSVRLPLESLTYNDWFTLTVTAKDVLGNTDTVSLRFKNQYIP